MEKYSLKEFKKVVEKADIIYGTCSLNAAVNVVSRIKKKDLLKHLETLSPEDVYEYLGFYATSAEDHKGRKILRLV